MVKKIYRRLKCKIKYYIRFHVYGREVIDKKNRRNLKNYDFSIISNNCTGGNICHDLGVQFRSPFVNLWIRPDEYVKLLGNLKEYMNEELIEIEEQGISYPIGLLKDIRVYFQHYRSFEDAKKKWEERRQRINYDKLYILFCDRDNCTEEDIKAFDLLPYEHKVCFTHIPMSYQSTFYIKGFENDNSVGMLMDYENDALKIRYIDRFNYVSWLNK